MCMEDIKLGRKKTVRVTTVNCPVGANTLLCDADPWRTAVIIMPAEAKVAVIGPEGTDLTGTSGLFKDQRDQPAVFDIETYGQAVVRKWFGACGTAATTINITVIEIFYNELQGPQ